MLEVVNYQSINVIFTRKIASLRIHVEHAIGRITNYRILDSVIPLTIASNTGNILLICCALTLFHPPLVTNSDTHLPPVSPGNEH